ncbi:MAG TPA: hypothetical protein VFO86_12810 [Terriglobia bacterium]|nr:hypothetical protein [Terriglobia bacterium]
MKPDEFDRVLSREAEIIPSSGFVRSVMAAVQSEAAAPPPIPFPWKRALPGILAFVAAIGWSVVDFIRYPAQQTAPAISSIPTIPSTVTYWFDGVVPLVDRARMFGAEWLLLGLLLTIVGLKLTRHLAGGRF